MKLLRLEVVLVAACCALSLPVFAQSNQATPDQSSTSSQAPSLVQPPQVGTPAKPAEKPFLAPKPLGHYLMFVEPGVPFSRTIIKRLDDGSYLQGSQAGDRSLDGEIYAKGRPAQSQGDFDRGIYLNRKHAGNDTCGAIVSYNFSPGENPTLQSVTTCTPANPEAPLRTGHEKQLRPPAPQLRKAVLESAPSQP